MRSQIITNLWLLLIIFICLHSTLLIILKQISGSWDNSLYSYDFKFCDLFTIPSLLDKAPSNLCLHISRERRMHAMRWGSCALFWLSLLESFPIYWVENSSRFMTLTRIQKPVLKSRVDLDFRMYWICSKAFFSNDQSVCKQLFCCHVMELSPAGIQGA